MKKCLTKKLELILLLALVISIVGSVFSFSDSCDSIRKKVLRLHIIANSDSEADQALKLRIRDRIISESAYHLGNAQTVAQAEEMISSQLDALCEAARREIDASGLNHQVRVELTEEFFPTRVYESVTLPAGRYRAVRVIIGNGNGRNWWCVMFPQLCVTAAEEKKELDAVFDEGEMEIVESEPEYEIRFKLIEWLQELFS